MLGLTPAEATRRLLPEAYRYTHPVSPTGRVNWSSGRSTQSF